MGFVNFVKKTIYIENVRFQRNQKDITDSNEIVMKLLALVAVLVFALFFFVSFFENSFRPTRFFYLGFVLTFLSLYLLLSLTGNRRLHIGLFYFTYAVLFLYAILSSAVIYPNDVCVIVYIFFMTLPMTIIDKQWRTILIQLIFFVSYLIPVIIVKEERILFNEIIFAVFFVIISLILGAIVSRARLKNIDMKRDAYVHETTDQLTLLYNRQRLNDFFIDYESNKLDCKIVGIAMIDIDWFKKYNDNYGHLMGDDCLVKIAMLLRDFCSRNQMSVYRYGGEEFLLILFESHSSVDTRIESIRRFIFEQKIPHDYSPNKQITISVGFIKQKISPNEAKISLANRVLLKRHKEQLSDIAVSKYNYFINCADKALYTAKNDGRNCVALYDDSMSDVCSGEIILADQLYD